MFTHTVLTRVFTVRDMTITAREYLRYQRRDFWSFEVFEGAGFFGLGHFHRGRRADCYMQTLMQMYHIPKLPNVPKHEAVKSEEANSCCSPDFSKHQGC